MSGAWEQALVLYLGSKLQSRQPNDAEAGTALAAILLKHWVRQLQPQGQSNLRIALELTTTAGEHLDDLLQSVWPEADRRAARMHVTGLLCETISQQASLCSCGHPTAVLPRHWKRFCCKLSHLVLLRTTTASSSACLCLS